MRTNITIIIIVIAFLSSIYSSVYGQNQPEADSLKGVLEQYDTLSLTFRLRIMNRIGYQVSSPEDKIAYGDRLLRLASQHQEAYYMINAHQIKGVGYRLKGNLDRSLESLFESARLAMEHEKHDLQAEAYLEIASTYTTNSDNNNALRYEKKAIDILRVHGEKDLLAINLLNTGYSYYDLGKLDSALLLYNEAEPIFEAIGPAIGKAYTIGNRALVYWKQGNHSIAERDLLQAISLLEPLGDQYGMADYHNQLGNIYLEQNNVEKSILHTQKALTMATDLDLKEQVRDASQLLSQLYTRGNNYQEALRYQTQYIAYKDSIESAEKTKEMADIRTAFEVDLREKEIDLLEERQSLQRTYIVIALILLVLAIVLLLYFRQRSRNARLLSAREREQHNEKVKDLLNTQETKALHAMIRGKDEERKRLAQELHTHFGNLFATIKVNLNGLESAAAPQQQTAMTLVDQACDDIRNISHTLNMGVSEDFGLIPALRELTTHVQQSGGMEVEFTAARCERRIDAQEEIVIYRIVQELVSNALRHSGANQLSVQLTCFEEENLLNILVQDNGRGFDPDIVSNGTDGMGLSSIKELVDRHKGEIEFDSHPAGGTTVSIDFPITPEYA